MGKVSIKIPRSDDRGCGPKMISAMIRCVYMMPSMSNVPTTIKHANGAMRIRNMHSTNIASIHVNFSM